MLWLFVISVFLLGYTYVGYPVLIGLLAKGWGKPVRKGSCADGVSILIAAHNEAEALPRKVEALLKLAEEEPIRQICLGLDGCTDDTAARVRAVLNHQADGSPDPLVSSVVHISEFNSQRGKAAVLNDLMKTARQPIWVMMDARQRVEAGAIPRLLENFADEQVGVVSGALVYEFAEGSAQKGAESYWGYEKYLRFCESQLWAVPGATGALYAIRKDLCHPIPGETLVDDVLIPMRAVLEGFRCLFDPTARVFDLPSGHFDQEGMRKRRTLAGIWQCLRLERDIFSPFANPIWFQWISHKFLRLLTPFFVIAAFFSLGVLAFDGQRGWLVLFFGVLAGFIGSLLAFLGSRKISSRWLGLLGAFIGVNLSLIQAAGDAWTGRFNSRWKT